MKCSNCGNDIGRIAVLLPTLDPKKRELCLKCADATGVLEDIESMQEPSNLGKPMNTQPLTPSPTASNKITIQGIIDGIGSPFGEGATYEYDSLHGYSHLNEQDRERLRKDLESFISSTIQKEKEAEREKSIKLFINHYDAFAGIWSVYRGSKTKGELFIQFLASLAEEGGK